MGIGKKKDVTVAKPSTGSTILISTLKQQSPKNQEKSEPTKDQTPTPVVDKEVKSEPRKPGEAHAGGSDRPPGRFPDFTGKDRQRYWEWVRFGTPLKIKLINGEILEGYLKWYDQFAVKLVTATDEIVLPKHSILYILDGPKPKPKV